MTPRIALVLLVFWSAGTAQVATARLEGVIRDASGAAVPGASLVVVNDRTQGTPVPMAGKGLSPVLESFDGAFVFYNGYDGQIWKAPAGGGGVGLILPTENFQ